MNSIGTISLVLALVVGVATIGAGFTGRKVWKGVNAFAWLVTVAGFAALQFADASLGLVAAVCATAGVAALRCATEAPARRQQILGFGAAVPIAIAVTGLVCVNDVVSPWPQHVVLYGAAWAALAAGLSSLVAAAAVGSRPVGTSLALAGAGGVIGLLVAGTGRGSLSAAFYGYPLRTADGPLHWVLAPVPGFEQGVRLAAAAPLPSVFWTLVVMGAVCLVAGIAARVRIAKLAAALWAGVAVAAIGLLASIQPTIAGLSAPAEDQYADHIQRLLLSRNMADRVATNGAWSSDGEIFVAMADLAPEVFALTFLTVIGLFAAFVTFRPGVETDAEVDAAFARDHAARGLGFAWITWFVAGLVHYFLFGSPGVGSPGEWALLGVLLGGTGLLIMGWRAENQLLRVVREIAPGLITAGLFIVAGFAWRFGALPAFTVGVF